MSRIGMTGASNLSPSQKLVKVLVSSQDSVEIVKALKKIPGMLEARTLEIDEVISPVVKLVASHNADVKAIACDLLLRASEEHPDVGLLIVNTLSADLLDPNPNVRSIAVSTICSLPILADQHALNAVSLALHDSNPLVRKAGVTGCGKVFRHSPQVVEDNDVVNTLYEQIKDPDPAVVTFSLQTLNVILESEGGIVINNNMAKYFVKRLTDFPDLELCFVFEYLEKHYVQRPDTTDERRLMLMNALDQYLESKRGSVFLSSSHLFYRCTKSLKEPGSNLVTDFLTRMRPQFSRFMKSTSQGLVQDFQIKLLDFVCLVDRDELSPIATEVLKDLHIKPKDNVALRKKKIEAICHVCQEDEAADTIKYILEQIKAQKLLTETLFEALIKLSREFPNQAECRLWGEFDSFFRNDARTFCLPLLQVIRKVPYVKCGESANVFQELCRNVLSGLTDFSESTLRTTLWILRRHCDVLCDAPYFLEQLIDEHEEQLVDFGLHQPLLITGVHVFARYPPTTQHTLGRIFELCFESGIPEIVSRVNFYSKLLQCDSAMKALLV